MADRYEYDPEAFDYAMPRTSTDPKQAGEFVRGAKYAPFDLLGAPVDIANLMMGGAGGTKPFLGSEYLIDKYADLGEAIGVNYDRPTGSTAETAGRIVGGVALDPGLLAAGIGLKFAQTTKTRGSGIEKKGTGSAQIEEPIQTVKAFKMFRKDKDGNLHPLFVKMGDKQPLPIGKWVDAEAGELNPKTGKVKSSLGDLAYRPGFHAGDTPSATHIGGKVDPVTGERVKGSMKPNIREENQVWAEVEMPADVDWQSIADARAVMTKKGTPDPKTAHITDEVPYGGYYRYKTNPNMQGNWLISGQMKINRVLDDDEVRAINEAAGTSDLPRLAELMSKSEARTSDLGPSKEVLEGEIIGEKSSQYRTLEKKAEASLSDAEKLARQEMMEQQGIADAFLGGKAGLNIDKTFEWLSRGDEGAYTSDDFVDGVIDSFGAARDRGMDSGDALVQAIREQAASYNDVFRTNAFDEASILNDIETSVNEDFGFSDALARYREGQANKQALESQLSAAKLKVRRAETEAKSRAFRQSIGITDDMPEAEAARIIQEYATKQQAGISGVGVPEPTPPKPNLRLVKKAAGGKVDLRSGIGDIFRVYS